MRIGFFLAFPGGGGPPPPPVPPPPLLLPPHAATSMAAATSAGAHHRSLLILLLLTPLQTFAAIDCDRSGRRGGLSSATALGARRRGRPARHDRGRKPDLRRLPVPVAEALEQQVRRRRADLAVRDAHRG